jgi:hypothetical protein
MLSRRRVPVFLSEIVAVTDSRGAISERGWSRDFDPAHAARMTTSLALPARLASISSAEKRRSSWNFGAASRP